MTDKSYVRTYRSNSSQNVRIRRHTLERVVVALMCALAVAVLTAHRAKVETIRNGAGWLIVVLLIAIAVAILTAVADYFDSLPTH